MYPGTREYMYMYMTGHCIYIYVFHLHLHCMHFSKLYNHYHGIVQVVHFIIYKNCTMIHLTIPVFVWFTENIRVV